MWLNFSPFSFVGHFWPLLTLTCTLIFVISLSLHLHFTPCSVPFHLFSTFEAFSFQSWFLPSVGFTSHTPLLVLYLFIPFSPSLTLHHHFIPFCVYIMKFGDDQLPSFSESALIVGHAHFLMIMLYIEHLVASHDLTIL